MYELAWITFGIVVTLVVTRLARLRATRAEFATGESVRERGEIQEPTGEADAGSGSRPADAPNEDSPQPATPLAASPELLPHATESPIDEAPTEGSPPIEPPAERPATEQPAATIPAAKLHAAINPQSHEVALSMASELANLLSAVEGRAHHLIEAAPARIDLPSAAEAMLASIDRLRVLHTKLVAFGRGRPVVHGTIDVNELISSLGDELQQMQLGLEFRWEPPAELPSIKACPSAVRDALLFTSSALLQAERGATRLTFTVERSFASLTPAIVIELHLEWVNVADSRKRENMDKHAFALDFEAARQLIEGHDGVLTMSHLPGKSVHALVSLPVAIPVEAQAATDAAKAAAKTRSDEPEDFLAISHHFGGALVLESDPALRAVLARELKASGRAVFACADGASAHTFLQATPDRFELLIVDDAHQLDEHTPLARTIRQRTPDLKICLLTPTPATSPEAWPDIHCLQKPFGVHELRRTLASILTVG